MATLTTGPVWDDHVQGGRTFCLKHLHPLFIDFSIPAVPATKRKPGRAELAVKMHISYSHHCFTEALDKFPNSDPDHLYNCRSRPGDMRVFCPIRWNESLALPDMIANMGACYFTRHENYFIWRSPTGPALGEYFVYFNVGRHPSGFVELNIESAYCRQDGQRQKKNAQKTSLNALVVNAIRGVKTHRPPR